MKFLAIFLSMTLTKSYSLPIGSVSSSGSFRSTVVLTPLENLGETVDNAVSVFAKSKAFSVVTPFPDSGRKMAILERKSLESLPIKVDDKYGNLQAFVADIVNPKPLVDTIQEHEKYGNDGEHFRKIANKVVGGIEGLSNVLNTAAELPFTALKHVGQTVTTSFNTVGGKLVGLSQ
ncbi:uncharacterized protein LOC108912585 [Anoplophora glabripennis]|uniref:uncharacterized protein LOC108912585 n=1 Tax=Anoplophora glabripennis TaxID=217634 RepID=UPI0008741D8A|nr:uncharacterized protein LOC108912585 [Anoplophora glabripennis]